MIKINLEETPIYDVIKYNCPEMCIHRTCDKRYTKYIDVEINGIEVTLAFCDEHAEKLFAK